MRILRYACVSLMMNRNMKTASPHTVDLTDSVMFDKLIETPRLCMLLNKDLSTAQLAALADTFFVVDIEHEGETRFAVVCGFYRKQPESKPMLLDPWGNLTEVDSDAE